MNEMQAEIDWNLCILCQEKGEPSKNVDGRLQSVQPKVKPTKVGYENLQSALKGWKNECVVPNKMTSVCIQS